MFKLNRDERLQLAQRVRTKAAGRVAVVASGTFEGTIEEKAEFVCEMGKIVDAVVVLVNQMCAEGLSHLPFFLIQSRRRQRCMEIKRAEAFGSDGDHALGAL